MDFLANPTVKYVAYILAAANAAALNYPGAPPIVVTVCSILAAVFTALGFGLQSRTDKALSGARLEALALRNENLALKGGKPNA